MPRRWYQTIEIDELDQTFEDVKRFESGYWGQGKFRNFIAPLLPEERNTFLEIGCNAGLFLQMAKDEGFRHVVGVEGNARIFQQAEHFQRHVKGDWKLLKESVGYNFDAKNTPLADVVLISNMHYYLSIDHFAQFVDEIQNRCLYCIVVSARAKRRSGNAVWALKHVRGYFKNWQEMKLVNGLPVGDDPTPRPQMYGVLFRGNLVPIGVDSIFIPWWEASKYERHRSFGLSESMKDFFEQVLKGNSFDFKCHSFYDYWKKRAHKRSDEWILKLLERKKELALDVQENGIKTPIYINNDGSILDGIHRLVLAKILNHGHISVKII